MVWRRGNGREGEGGSVGLGRGLGSWERSSLVAGDSGRSASRLLQLRRQLCLVLSVVWCGRGRSSYCQGNGLALLQVDGGGGQGKILKVWRKCFRSRGLRGGGGGGGEGEGEGEGDGGGGGVEGRERRIKEC